MALVINTNVSSLTSQRALAESKSELSTAMERLSTGLKINSASDDAAGLAMTQRMTAQVRGLSMAVKNANDGIAMTKSVEGAIGEVSDMLQRMRELAIQAANGTNSSADRTFLQNEVNLLIQEITRVSTNTRYNGELILDGTFLNKNLQVGIEEGEVITMSVESIAAENIGAHTLVGNGVGARPPQVDAMANPTGIADDVEIFGFLGTKSIAASVGDTAKQTAVKINNLTGLTGVKAYAKSYAAMYSASTTNQTYSVAINGYTTGNFVIGSGDVENAVDAINQISGSTGVTAHSEDNKVVLFDADGDDITIENLQTLDGHDQLRVRKIDESGAILQADGVTTNYVGGEVRLAVSSATSFDSTRVTGTLKLTSPNAFSVDQKVRGTDDIIGNTTKDHVDSLLTNIKAVTGQDLASFANGIGTHTGGAGNITLNGSLASGGTIDLRQPGVDNSVVAREVRIHSTNGNNNSGINFTVTGTLADGTATTEVIAGGNGASAAVTVSGTKKFVTITQIATNNTVNGTVTVGMGGDVSTQTATALNINGLTGVQQYVVGDVISFPGSETGSTAENPILHTITVAPNQNGSGAQTITFVPPIAQDKATLTAMAGTPAITLETPGYMIDGTQTAALHNLTQVNISTMLQAGDSISIIDAALDKVAQMRANLGAIENRLDYTITNLMNIGERTADSRSRLEDADYALESSRLAKAQVIQQAGTQMLSQANQMTQLVLDLLR